MAMNGNTRVRLSIMMFLQYAFNGIWIIPLGAYLNKVGYTGAQIGSVYGTFAIGCIVAPFFVGMIADRFFNAEKVLAVLNLAAAGLLLLMSQIAVTPTGGVNYLPFYLAMLGHCICYAPTWALTNTIALNQCTNPGKQFPSIRGLGTIGWIVVSMACLFSGSILGGLGIEAKFEESRAPMLIGAAIGILSGILAFIQPKTPPKVEKGEKTSFSDILGLRALSLFKDRNFLIFAIASFLVFFPGMFYWAFANIYLNDNAMADTPAWQSSGQMTEMVFIFLMPLFFRRLGVKKMLLLGLLAWAARFGCFALGIWDIDSGGTMWIFVLLGLMLHGPCFDFFFVTGQLYTDKKAPKVIQAQAQGLISLITFGLGWFVGSTTAGYVVDKYAVEEVAVKEKFAIVQKADQYSVSYADAKFNLATKKAEGEKGGMTLTTVGEPQGATFEKSTKDAVVKVGKERLTISYDDKKDKFIAIRKTGRFTVRSIELAKAAKDAEEYTVKPVKTHVWKKIWLWPIGMAGAIIVFFGIFFNDKMKVGQDEDDVNADDATPAEEPSAA